MWPPPSGCSTLLSGCTVSRVCCRRSSTSGHRKPRRSCCYPGDTVLNAVLCHVWHRSSGCCICGTLRSRSRASTDRCLCHRILDTLAQAANIQCFLYRTLLKHHYGPWSRFSRCPICGRDQPIPYS
ncbi:hypothetical protein BD311DRAFT_752969 [Dichomitus squalens]|uniref:Uncharacterized protein n=1 Tax=Dichomitus squalens TaxID=114155 RepID=A0A4Q9MXH8_9APHY|nr:hypothetical protein BD311DRAFT_752969 [Dichomitus squalens]